MSELRKKAVEEAKAKGICTQCLKHKAAPHRYQCQRCIDTNQRKQRKRSVIMKKATREAHAKGICTKCLKNKAVKGFRYCEACREKDRARKKNERGGGVVKHSEETKRRIGDAIRKSNAMKKGREQAFAKKDVAPKRKYTRHVELTPVQMQGMVNELEMFIATLPNMTASEYLEAREVLIKNIVLRGGKTNGS